MDGSEEELVFVRRSHLLAETLSLKIQKSDRPVGQNPYTEV
jgi:hypothetical protein